MRVVLRVVGGWGCGGGDGILRAGCRVVCLKEGGRGWWGVVVGVGIKQ